MRPSSPIPLALAAATVLAACAEGPAGPGPAQAPLFSVGQKPGTWASLTPVPTADSFSIGVEGMSVGRIGNQIVAAFGHDRLDRATTRIYDIASDSWSFGADGPGPNSEGAGVAHGGLLYSLGGRLVGARADIWSYDPAADSWNAGLTPMDTGRAGLAVAVVGNAIYAIGGRLATGGPCTGFGFLELASVERYDIPTDTWTSVAPLPSPRSDLAAATVGGKIYVFGGCRGPDSVLADVDVYDPGTDTWSTAPADLPTPRAAMYAVETRAGTVYVIGGWDGVGLGLSTNEAYDASSDQWVTGLPPMPTARAETGAASHNGKIYILGGARPGFGASVAAVEAFKP